MFKPGKKRHTNKAGISISSDPDPNFQTGSVDPDYKNWNRIRNTFYKEGLNQKTTIFYLFDSFLGDFWGAGEGRGSTYFLPIF